VCYLTRTTHVLTTSINLNRAPKKVKFPVGPDLSGG
jgi:hypothetical protein